MRHCWCGRSFYVYALRATLPVFCYLLLLLDEEPSGFVFLLNEEAHGPLWLFFPDAMSMPKKTPIQNDQRNRMALMARPKFSGVANCIAMPAISICAGCWRFSVSRQNLMTERWPRPDKMASKDTNDLHQRQTRAEESGCVLRSKGEARLASASSELEWAQKTLHFLGASEPVAKVESLPIFVKVSGRDFICHFNGGRREALVMASASFLSKDTSTYFAFMPRMDERCLAKITLSENACIHIERAAFVWRTSHLVLRASDPIGGVDGIA